MTKQIEDIKSARAVIWPFRKMNQPMGELLDNGSITPKDLDWTFDNSIDIIMHNRILYSTEHLEMWLLGELTWGSGKIF